MGAMGYSVMYSGRDYMARPVQVFHWDTVVSLVRETLRRHGLELVELGPKPEGDDCLGLMVPLRAVVKRVAPESREGSEGSEGRKSNSSSPASLPSSPSREVPRRTT